MDILSVIRSHGHTTYTLAKAMKIKQSSLSNVINGNPTIKTLRLMAEKIPCSVAEFFMDELSREELIAFANTKTPEKKTEGDNEQSAEEAKVLRFNYDCPHCGKSVKISIEQN